MPAETMIECENLTKRFGHFTAVDRVSLKITKGSIFGFHRDSHVVRLVGTD
jgi:ABC-type multidrug transport system ATPase subunit